MKGECGIRNAECGPNLIWEGKPRLKRWLFSPPWSWTVVPTTIRLTPNALWLQFPCRRGGFWIPLDRVQKVEVHQNWIDRSLKTGTLRLVFKGSRSMELRAIHEPYELWKRIKIARFQSQRPA